jgi:hypothetical protein
MEFLVILGIGTLVAVWAVANLPKTRGHRGASNPSFDLGPGGTPPWKKDIVESHAMGDLEYLEKLDRHQRDPQHWPCPLPPEREE